MEPVEYQRMADLEATFWWYRNLHDTVTDWLQALALPAGAAVLDAGCGTGGLLERLRPQFPQLVLQGLEFDAGAAAIARRKSGLDILNGRVEALPCADGSLQAIISNDVLYHANVDEAAALREFHRCLQPGGHLFLNLPAYEWLRSSHDRQVHTARRYTCRRLCQSLQAAGFTVRRCSYRNGLLLPLMVLHRLTAGQSKASSDVEPLAPWLDGLLYTVASIERRLNRHGLHLPCGGSVKAWATRP